MALTFLPNGLMGFPLIGAAPAMSIPSGTNATVLFVDAAQSGDGSGPQSALSSITSALATLPTDGTAYGSTIYVAPGTYDENVTVSIAGVSIIGSVLGGYERPDVVPTAGVALTVTTGQGFYCQHMRFASADSDTVVQNANGAVYLDCVFDGDSGQASTETNLRFVPSATDDSYSASENLVMNCLIRGSNGSGITFQHALLAGGGEGTTDNKVIGCTFYDNAVSDLISKTNTNGGGAGIYINLVVNGCNFETTGASYKYINFSAGAAGDLTANTCIISGNWFADEALTGGTGGQIDLGGQSKAQFVGNFDAAGVVNGTTFNN